MNSTFLFALLLSVLTPDMQKIATNLASPDSKIRKTARQEAFALPKEKKLILIKELKSSSDPELSETAKELMVSINGPYNKWKILQMVLDRKHKEIEEIIRVNPQVFRESFEKKLTILDVAEIMNDQKFIDLFKKYKLPKINGKMKLMDVLVVESDSWESLANDFNTTVTYLRIFNYKKELIPGTIVKVPRTN